MASLARVVALHDPSCPHHQPHATPTLPAHTAECLGRHWCIEDLEAYVQASLNKSRRIYTIEEREDLVSESIRICLELASKFDPHRNGYENAGRLCGYIAKFLPLKAEDAYHRLHPEHRLVTQPDGRRRYAYGERAVSLEALTADDPDREMLLSDRTHDHDIGDVAHVTVEQIAEKLGLTGRQFDHAVTEIRQLARKLGSWGAASTVATVASLLRDRCEERYDTGLRVAGVLARDAKAADRDIAQELGTTIIEVREARADLEPVAMRLRTLNRQ